MNDSVYDNGNEIYFCMTENDYNYNILVGADRDSIVNAYISHSFANDFDRELYGGGKASCLIIEKLLGDEK